MFWYLAQKNYRKRQIELLQNYPQLAVFSFDLISSTIAFDGLYEKPELTYLSERVFKNLKLKRLCLDVGANIGNHSVFFTNHFDEVIAFEPHPRTFKLLEANAWQLPKLKPIMMGASDRKAELVAWYNPRNIGAASVEETIWNASEKPKDKRTHSTTLSLERLDKLVPKLKHDEVDFIKIDAEGHELNVLKGAIEIIGKSKPPIAIELSGGVSRITETVEFLKTLGYAHFSAPKRDIDRNSIFTRASEFTAKVSGRRRPVQFRKIENYIFDDYPMVLVQHKDNLLAVDGTTPA